MPRGWIREQYLRCGNLSGARCSPRPCALSSPSSIQLGFKEKSAPAAVRTSAGVPPYHPSLTFPSSCSRSANCLSIALVGTHLRAPVSTAPSKVQVRTTATASSSPTSQRALGSISAPVVVPGGKKWLPPSSIQASATGRAAGSASSKSGACGRSRRRASGRRGEGRARRRSLWRRRAGGGRGQWHGRLPTGRSRGRGRGRAPACRCRRGRSRTPLLVCFFRDGVGETWRLVGNTPLSLPPPMKLCLGSLLDHWKEAFAINWAFGLKISRIRLASKSIKASSKPIENTMLADH